MLTDIQLEKYAKVLFWGMQKARVTPFAPGDIVLVRTDLAALPLAEKMQSLILSQGLNPVLRINHPSTLEKNYFGLAEQDQLSFVIPGDRELYEHLAGLVSLLAPDSITHLKDIPPTKIATFSLARKYLRDILDKREANRMFGWTLCLMPTLALAENAGLSPEDYAAQIIRASYLDEADPVSTWEDIFRQAHGVKAWLNGMDVEYYHVQSASTDLKVSPGESRCWIGISGHNIPSFELFISPDCRLTKGTYHADQPSYRSGNLVSGVTLEFSEGMARVIRADQGEDFVRSQLDMDPGACRLGEFSLTDKRFSPINAFMAHTLFDENFGGEHGNCHVAVGASYADTYAGDPAELTDELKKDLGFNDSALHWDLVNTEPKKVTAFLQDGTKTVIYEDGMFTMPDLA
ncbi:MAG: aminopeptidase [Deltaproteobacteria bacterium HGW-Deltaproteobacteria-18]|jgi:aminopeptidase|nr:MAG: aminopeptidase [Deltaproteobacteria bacterium HGW-Deltaproteobacteria-18]PKN45881.1 MAG: aminopeptidase [Deltaproteobacteria bacterium HGW-Deltaproteobacteria-20]